jgi:threonine dehydrogenase-like Zn-dependent dehydrogenase
MKALVFRFSLPRLAVARFAGKLTPRAYVGWFAPIQLEEVEEPSLLGDRWTVVHTALTGICGSDVKQVFLNGNFDNPLRALISFPQILGHEVVGVIEHLGPGVKTRKVGERVVLNPWLSCGPRGLEPPCDACQRGEYSLCSRFTEGDLPPGLHHGNCRTATGGYAPLLPAHESQLIPIPPEVSFDQAVLGDPFAVAMHAILKAPPGDGALTLVYGAGVLGLLTVAALRVLFPRARVVVIARYPHQVELAYQLEAEQVISTRDPAEVVETIAELVRVQVHRPPRGLPWLLRGVDAIYDMVGSAESLEVGVRIVNPKAPIVVAGVAMPARFEWTPHYFKEVNLIGSNAFGIEEYGGLRLHAIEHYLRLVEMGKLDLTALITHRFRLEEYREAFLTMHSKARHRGVKGVFDFQAPYRSFGCLPTH